MQLQLEQATELREAPISHMLIFCVIQQSLSQRFIMEKIVRPGSRSNDLTTLKEKSLELTLCKVECLTLLYVFLVFGLGKVNPWALCFMPNTFTFPKIYNGKDRSIGITIERSHNA